jgi:hypothetical protein
MDFVQLSPSSIREWTILTENVICEWGMFHYITFLVEVVHILVEHRALKNVNNCLNTNIHSYLETSGGQSSNLYLNVVHFFNTSVN